MENTPKCNIDKIGTKYWHTECNLHREDGPAVEYKEGTKEWHVNGKLHRLDGPAYIRNNGESEWYINDCDVTSEIYPWAKENDIDLNNLSNEDINLIKLFWSDFFY